MNTHISSTFSKGFSFSKNENELKDIRIEVDVPAEPEIYTPFFNSIEQTKLLGPPLFTLLFHWSIKKEQGQLHLKKVMQRYNGTSLGEFQFPQNEDNNIGTTKFKIIFTLLEGIRFLHSHHIVHMNLNPSNVINIINDESTWPAIDNTGFYITNYQDMIMYVAPEIRDKSDFQKESYSKSCDIYSLGMLLYFILVNGDIEKIQKISEEQNPTYDLTHERNEFLVIIFDMLNHDEKKRPKIELVYQKFKDSFPAEFEDLMKKYKEAQQNPEIYEKFRQFYSKGYKGTTFEYNHKLLPFVDSVKKSKFSYTKVQEKMKQLIGMFHPAYKIDQKPANIKKDRKIFDSLGLLFRMDGEFHSMFFTAFCFAQGKSPSLLNQTIEKCIRNGYIQRNVKGYVLLNAPFDINNKEYRESVELFAVLRDCSILNSVQNSELLKIVKQFKAAIENQESNLISDRIFELIYHWYCDPEDDQTGKMKEIMSPKKEKSEETKDIEDSKIYKRFIKEKREKMKEIMKSCNFDEEVSEFMIKSLMDLERLRIEENFMNEIDICSQINQYNLVQEVSVEKKK